MARGFDSKSVTDQQEEKARAADRVAVMAEAPTKPVQATARRRSLELAKIDLQRRIAGAPEAHRVALGAALAELEDLIAKA